MDAYGDQVPLGPWLRPTPRRCGGGTTPPRLGFVEEGRLRPVFRHNAEWIDKFTMGLLATELR